VRHRNSEHKSAVLSQTELQYCNRCNSDLSLPKITPLPPPHIPPSGYTQDCTPNIPLTSETKLSHKTQHRIIFIRNYAKNGPQILLVIYSYSRGHHLLYQHSVLKDFCKAYRRVQCTTAKSLRTAELLCLHFPSVSPFLTVECSAESGPELLQSIKDQMAPRVT